MLIVTDKWNSRKVAINPDKITAVWDLEKGGSSLCYDHTTIEIEETVEELFLDGQTDSPTPEVSEDQLKIFMPEVSEDQITGPTCAACGSRDVMGVQYDHNEPECYDGISEWRCKCGARTGRWSNKILKPGEVEKRYGGY